MAARTLIAALLIGVIAAACTPRSTASTTTTIASDVSTTTPGVPESTTSTTAPGDLEAPERGDPDDVAANAFWDAGIFGLADEPSTFDQDALTAIEQWLPGDLVDGLVWEVFVEGSGPNVLAVSVIPTLTWRGDPNFVPSLVATLTDADAEEISEGIYQAETSTGLVLYAWSTGDGFVVATSIVADVAIGYLESLATETGPQTVWEPETCLYIDPEVETLPYAPFPRDIAVPCVGPHNAEVLVSVQIGTDLNDFDASSIEYDRNYRCDKAYTEAFGPQKDHTPSLITYMPDPDEWDRGDRYLACVVQIETIEGPLLFVGPMSERIDLDWNPVAEACLDRSFAPESVDCGRPHGYQYLGDARVTVDEWPADGTAAFQDACADLVEEFVRTGPARVDVFATGLFPYAFELGDRSVQCLAFAIEDGLLVDVAGSFGEVWRVIGSGGIAA